MITGLVLFTIALGVFFIMIEIFLIPGTTIFGVAGAGAIIAALYFAYTNEPSWLGNVALLSTVGLSILMFFLGKKMAQSQSLSLVEKEIKGRVNQQEHFEEVQIRVNHNSTLNDTVHAQRKEINLSILVGNPNHIHYMF